MELLAVQPEYNAVLLSIPQPLLSFGALFALSRAFLLASKLAERSLTHFSRFPMRSALSWIFFWMSSSSSRCFCLPLRALSVFCLLLICARSSSGAFLKLRGKSVGLAAEAPELCDPAPCEPWVLFVTSPWKNDEVPVCVGAEDPALSDFLVLPPVIFGNASRRWAKAAWYDRERRGAGGLRRWESTSYHSSSLSFSLVWNDRQNFVKRWVCVRDKLMDAAVLMSEDVVTNLVS